jgi:hypothetical protein
MANSPDGFLRWRTTAKDIVVILSQEDDYNVVMISEDAAGLAIYLAGAWT